MLCFNPTPPMRLTSHITLASHLQPCRQSLIQLPNGSEAILYPILGVLSPLLVPRGQAAQLRHQSLHGIVPEERAKPRMVVSGIETTTQIVLRQCPKHTVLLRLRLTQLPNYILSQHLTSTPYTMGGRVGGGRR
eukprot:Hpha_TRINITY_DN16000_c0_g1::TRINITY_DN16000_c0_g1_i2::g.120189::m.120189